MSDQALRAELVRKLVTGGALTDSRWIDAFTAVPRHTFIPTFWHRTAPGASGLRHITGSAPDRLTITYRDNSLITQLDADGIATCASSQPSSMARMLEALDVRPGHRVLEVGTGTGYNAALLAYRVGSENVTTVEYDPGLSATAAQHLAACGYRKITLVVGDGERGHPAEAPYDRIAATYGLRRIPAPWIRQLAPGGIIVASIGYGLVALHAAADGRSARGRFLPTACGFMWSRTEPNLTPAEALRITRADGHSSETDADVRDYDDESFIAWLRLFAPDIARTRVDGRDGAPEYVFAANPTDWVRVGDGTVARQGATWSRVLGAQQTWRAAQRPGWDRLGLTVDDAGGHLLWADEPDSSYRWPL